MPACSRFHQTGPMTGSRLPFRPGNGRAPLPRTLEAAQGPDFMFMCGGGILAHPNGPAAGIASLHEAYQALMAGQTIAEGAKTKTELAAAIDFFGAH